VSYSYWNHPILLNPASEYSVTFLKMELDGITCSFVTEARGSAASSVAKSDNYLSVFSYGSNSIYQLRGRVDNYSLQSRPAFLEGYKKIFCKHSEKWNGGVASIIPKKYIKTYGIIVELTLEELNKLDKYETGYSKIYVECTIIKDNDNIFDPLSEQDQQIHQKIQCIAYQANDHEWIDPPSQEYLVAIKVMLDEHDLFKKYMSFIVVSKYDPLINKIENLQKWKYPSKEKLELRSFLVIVNSMKKNYWKMPHDLNNIINKLNKLDVRSINDLELLLKNNNNIFLLIFKLSTLKILKKLLS